MLKRGQITVFIIIGLVLLLIIGSFLYLTRREVTKPFEAARPKIAEIAQDIQPLRDMVESCIRRLATDGLRRIGDSGGYIDASQLSFNILSPTEGEAVQFSPEAGPTIAYWWHLKTSNKCEGENCIFDSKRPGLYRGDGGTNIEGQLDAYVTGNLKECLGNFEDYKKRGCDVQELDEPKVTANVAQDDMFFVGKYRLRAICGDQSYDLEDYYVSMDVNIREIYELATELVNYEIQSKFLEQATKTLIYSFSEIDRNKLPPPRDMEVGPPKPGAFWLKFEVLKKLKSILMSYVPVIQVSSVRSYRYITAPPGSPDKEAFELMYNRQFLIPLNVSHPNLEAHFMYLDWWEPYFDLGCNGQLCRADSATNFQLLPFTLNRYNFAYDLSYPVLLEIRNPYAFNNEGYSFKLFIEQNMRNTDAMTTDALPFEPVKTGRIPSIFCNPEQQTSGTVTLNVKDGKTLKGMEKATVSYLCGDQSCNFGFTQNGILSAKFPRCVGGILRIVKQGYASHSSLLDTDREEPITADVMLEPVRVLNATVKNYAITKQGKRGSWEFREGGPLRPDKLQQTVVQMTRNGTIFDEPFSAIVEIKGDQSSEISLIPGKYIVSVNSFYRSNITIPPDYRCFKIKKLTGSKKKCYYIPEEPIIFNETAPFPYGGAEFEYEITSSMLRNAKRIEFRQFVLSIDDVPEANRIVEDLNEIDKVKLYATANLDRIRPVIS